MYKRLYVRAFLCNPASLNEYSSSTYKYTQARTNSNYIHTNIPPSFPLRKL